MIIVKYGSNGMKSVIEEDASRTSFSALYRRQKKQAAEKENEPYRYVTWLGPGCFEVTDDRWAAGYVYKIRPDNWPRTNGEPA